MPIQQLARQLVRRRLSSPVYSAGVRNTIAIDRDGVLLELALRVVFTVTTTASAPTSPLWQTLARIFRRVEVVVNGQDTVVSIDGAHLASRCHIETGCRALGMDATVSVAASTATTYDITLPLPFYLMNSRRPDDSALDLRIVQQAVLAVTWGDATDLFGTPNAATVSGVSCEVMATYVINEDPKATYLTRALDLMTINNAASNANLTALMDRGSGLWWKSFHFATLRNNVAVQNILTGDLKLYAGSLTYVNLSPQMVQAAVIRKFAVPYGELTTAERVYRFDLDNIGQNTTLINAGQLAGDLYAAFGTTYTSGTEVITMSREALRGLRI